MCVVVMFTLCVYSLFPSRLLHGSIWVGQPHDNPPEKEKKAKIAHVGFIVGVSFVYVKTSGLL